MTISPQQPHKKAVAPIPNQRLKRERELRGWSQKHVANSIGADHYYLSRWERGTSSPSPYYRQKLCALFGKDASELGLIDDPATVASEGAETEAAVAAAQEEPVYDYAIPPTFTLETPLIGRSDSMKKLKQRLCVEPATHVAALHGLPGAGKTTLAIALAHDKDILDYFTGGILWAGLGPQPNIMGHLGRWGSLLGISPTEAKRLADTANWTQAIRAAIGQRRILFIIDDIWDINDGLAFKFGGPGCSYVITSRFPHIAAHWAGQHAMTIHELDEIESIDLLTHIVPELVAQKQQVAQSLVRCVGRLPLALTIMGKYLRAQTYSGQPRRIQAALDKLNSTRERLYISMPQALTERTPSLATEDSISLISVIRVSEQQLAAREQQAFRSLSVFPAKPNTFSEEAALAVCQVNPEVLDHLTDAGLLEASGPSRYTLHQVVSDYAREHLDNPLPYQRLTSYIVQYINAHEQAYDWLEQESSNILAILQAPADNVPLVELIQASNVYARFLLMRGLYVQGREILTRTLAQAHELADPLLLATTLLNFGRVLQRQAEYAQAEVYFREGLLLARQSQNAYIICDLLQAFGSVQTYQDDALEGEAVLLEALALARQLQDAQRICALLKVLAACMNDQGKYDQGAILLHEGLQLASQIKDQELQVDILANLGQSAGLQGDYKQAEDCWQEALIIARQIGYNYAVSTILGNLGAICIEQGQSLQAYQYLQESLDIARRMDDPVNITTHVANLGMLATEQGSFDEAAVWLQEAMERMQQIDYRWLQPNVLCAWGNYHVANPHGDLAVATSSYNQALEISLQNDFREPQAEALYGLAQVAAARKNDAEARQLGQQSLAIFTEINSRLAQKVQKWLTELTTEQG